MNERDEKGIKNIIKHIVQINHYVSTINSLEEFGDSSLVVDAVIFNLLQIGEIVRNKVSLQIKEENLTIPWRKIYGLRNRLIHDYDNILMDIVYETIIEDLPKLLIDLRDLLK